MRHRITRAFAATGAILTTVLALTLLNSGTASAADVTPPQRCGIDTFENIVAATIRDEALDHTRFAVRAISRDGNRTYAFLGRVSVDAPRTDRDTEYIRFDTDLTPGDWSFAVRAFDNGAKSSWTGCGTHTISASADLTASCGIDEFNQRRASLDMFGTTSNAVPDNVEFRFSLTNNIYGVTVDLDPTTVTRGVDTYRLAVPDAVRPGSWFVSLDVYRDGQLEHSDQCGKIRALPGIEPLPDFSCSLAASTNKLFVLIDHSGLPDGYIYAVNLERGERPNEEFIYLGRLNEDDDQDDDDDQGVITDFARDLVEPNAGWHAKARYIAPDGTKSDRIDCGETY